MIRSALLLGVGGFCCRLGLVLRLGSCHADVDDAVLSGLVMLVVDERDEVVAWPKSDSRMSGDDCTYWRFARRRRKIELEDAGRLQADVVAGIDVKEDEMLGSAGISGTEGREKGASGLSCLTEKGTPTNEMRSCLWELS